MPGSPAEPWPKMLPQREQDWQGGLGPPGDSGGRQEGLGTRAHASWTRSKPSGQGRAGLGDFRWHGDRRERILAFRNVYSIRKLIHYARDSVTKYKTHARTRDKLSPGRSPSAWPGEMAVTRVSRGSGGGGEGRAACRPAPARPPRAVT